PNSEVKRQIADGSVGFPHVRVGHRQALNKAKPQLSDRLGFLLRVGTTRSHPLFIAAGSLIAPA
ncbi:hypothetical protein, partial [Endozoicomonas sp. ISHI1]|uniref:hypothetical protein n=1 Tax=Endozoicomonas sp. ISHI1 TaxID=2825882 RepID=UPI002147CEA3